MTLEEELKKSVEEIPMRIANYLDDRGIDASVRKHFEIGYGKFYGRFWIVIPIRDVKGRLLFFKLRQDPADITSECKYNFYPQGSSATIYGWETLANSEVIVYCEGEFDRLVLLERGVPVITSTGGCMTFKEEWLEAFTGLRKLYICFDNDDPGRKAAAKLSETIFKKKIDLSVFNIVLPENVGEAGDITDYFIKCHGTVDDLFGKYSHEIKRSDLAREEPVAYVPSSSSDIVITKDDIERAKQVSCAKFVEVVRSDYDKSWASCPFHEESKASLCCYDKGRGFFCFGCGVGGDTITFVERTQNLDFKAAVKYILNK